MTDNQRLIQLVNSLSEQMYRYRLEYVKDARPCAMCKKTIINAGIKKIVIRNTKDKYTIIDVEEFIKNDETLDGAFGY